MKRLCIYVIYDYDKIIDKYIGLVLDEINRFVDRMVVVCNYDEIKRGRNYIDGKYDEIYFRRNKGYDAGAYKDVLDNLIGWNRVYQYDELLLTNDTFIGPLYPFSEMYEAMNNDPCDYWGITRHPEGEFTDGYKYPSHIQSFFLMFKSKIFHSDDFREFWNNYKASDEKINTIYSFELGINIYLNKKGFVGKAYMDLKDLDFAKEYSMNPYSMHPYELIKDARIPVIKKNILFFDNRGYVNTLKALEYINQNLNYDITAIKDYIRRFEDTKKDNTVYDFVAMERFINSHEKIYIYGKGIWANIMTLYFEYRKWKIDGYIVTRMTKENQGANVFHEMNFNETDGIIVAQRHKKNGFEIYQTLLSKCSSAQIFMPVYR